MLDTTVSGSRMLNVYPSRQLDSAFSNENLWFVGKSITRAVHRLTGHSIEMPAHDRLFHLMLQTASFYDNSSFKALNFHAVRDGCNIVIRNLRGEDAYRSLLEERSILAYPRVT